MAGRKSRSKGQRGERESADLLSRLLGIDFRRAQQYKGTETSADIETVEEETSFRPEIKRTEHTISKALYAALQQAKEEAGDNIPFVMSRRNHENWVFCVDEKYIDRFCHEYVRLKELGSGRTSDA